MRKITLFIASLFMTLAAVAQTPALKLRDFGSTVPYKLTDDEAATVFAMTDLTVSINVNIPATAWADNTRAALFCTSSPSTAANTDSKGMNSAYVAYGLSYANSELSSGYLASCKAGDRFTKGDIAWGEDVVLTYVINPTNKTCKLFINGERYVQWVNAHADGFQSGYEIATPKMVKEDYKDACIYVGAGVTFDGYCEAFNGTINAINIYDVVLSDDEIANIDFYEEERAAALAIVEGIEGKIGYPTNDVIENYKSAVNEATNLGGIEAAKQDLYGSTDVNLPVDGKAYTFTFVQKNGTEHYMNCTGTAVSPVAPTADPIPYTAVFVAEDNGDGTFAFRAYNDKYVKYPKLNNGISDSKDDYTKIIIGKILDNNNFVYDGNENLFGLLHMNSLSSGTEYRYFVVDGNGAWGTSTTYHYEYDNSGTRRFSSAVRIEEVKVKEVKEGAYYRLKNVQSEYYATSNMCTNSSYSTKLAMEENGETAVSVWYLDENNAFLSYVKGQYLGNFALSNGTWSLEAIGTAGNSVEFVQGATYGKYQIKPSSGRALYGDAIRVDAANDTNNSGNYYWTLEEVTSLPVTIKASAKYATFHAPVAVEVPEGVTAHTVTINGEWATLSETPLTVIPANTAVILHAEGITEDTVFDFAITTSEPFSGENALAGTVAAKYAGDEVYVLANVNGNVGLYKTATPESFVLKGHAAYLPASALTAEQQQSVGFRFDFNTTAIEEVETENGVEAVYDLQGRRINEITQPGIYVVNGVKVLVK